MLNKLKTTRYKIINNTGFTTIAHIETKKAKGLNECQKKVSPNAAKADE